ncbi:MAG: Holliday junction resolvase RuvX [Candidatus Cloacimonadota bacterium]|nr:Holliday junction resolvase RuvX [Candidatus Cloacimonadota bacterium]
MKRLLGIDFGERRIGIALSDESMVFSSPYITIDVKKTPDYFKKIHKIIGDKQVTKIVIGNPLNVEGQDTHKSKTIKQFADKLANLIEVPIVFWDETHTTLKAKEILKLNKKSLKKHKKELDKIAASLMLEDYMQHSS